MKSLDGRPRMVGGQFKDWRRTQQLLFPIAQLSLENLARQPVSLPVCKIRILDRHLRQRCRPVRTKRVVEYGHLTDQNSGRPAVGYNMMHRQQPDVLVLAKRNTVARTRGPWAKSKGRWASLVASR